MAIGISLVDLLQLAMSSLLKGKLPPADVLKPLISKVRPMCRVLEEAGALRPAISTDGGWPGSAQARKRA